MKKKVLAILTSLVMIMTMPYGVFVASAEEAATTTLVLENGEAYYSSDNGKTKSGSAVTITGLNYESYDENNKKWVMRDFSLTANKAVALYVKGDTKIEIKGTNTITAKGETSATEIYALRADGNLTLSGSGTLNLKAEGGDDIIWSAGAKIDGKLANSANLKAEAGDAIGSTTMASVSRTYEGSYGLLIHDDITNEGSIDATAGSGYFAYAITSEEGTIKNTNVASINAKVMASSITEVARALSSVKTGGGLITNYGTVNATVGEMTATDSTGDGVVSSGTIKNEAGATMVADVDSCEAGSIGINCLELTNEGTIKAKASDVTGNSAGTSSGIYAMTGNVTLGEGSQTTVIAGKVPEEVGSFSYGITANGNVILNSGAKLLAQGYKGAEFATSFNIYEGAPIIASLNYDGTGASDNDILITDDGNYTVTFDKEAGKTYNAGDPKYVYIGSAETIVLEDGKAYYSYDNGLTNHVSAGTIEGLEYNSWDSKWRMSDFEYEANEGVAVYVKGDTEIEIEGNNTVTAKGKTGVIENCAIKADGDLTLSGYEATLNLEAEGGDKIVCSAGAWVGGKLTNGIELTVNGGKAKGSLDLEAEPKGQLQGSFGIYSAGDIKNSGSIDATSDDGFNSAAVYGGAMTNEGTITATAGSITGKPAESDCLMCYAVELEGPLTNEENAEMTCTSGNAKYYSYAVIATSGDFSGALSTITADSDVGINNKGTITATSGYSEAASVAVGASVNIINSGKITAVSKDAPQTFALEMFGVLTNTGTINATAGEGQLTIGIYISHGLADSIPGVDNGVNGKIAAKSGNGTQWSYGIYSPLASITNNGELSSISGDGDEATAGIACWGLTLGADSDTIGKAGIEKEGGISYGIYSSGVSTPNPISAASGASLLAQGNTGAYYGNLTAYENASIKATVNYDGTGLSNEDITINEEDNYSVSYDKEDGDRYNAGDPKYVYLGNAGTLVLDDGKAYYSRNDGITNGPIADGLTGLTYDATNKKWVMNNFSFTANEGVAVYVKGDTEIELKGTNTITANGKTGKTEIYALRADDNIKLSGTGTLNLTAKGGDDIIWSAGAKIDGKLVNGANLKAEAGDATKSTTLETAKVSQGSYGIYVLGDITNNGKIDGTAGSGWKAFGVDSTGGNIVNNENATIKGTVNASEISGTVSGIAAEVGGKADAGNIKNYGEVSATVGEMKEEAGWSFGVVAFASILNDKKAKMTANVGNCAYMSFGVCSGTDLTNNGYLYGKTSKITGSKDLGYEQYKDPKGSTYGIASQTGKLILGADSDTTGIAGEVPESNDSMSYGIGASESISAASAAKLLGQGYSAAINTETFRVYKDAPLTASTNYNGTGASNTDISISTDGNYTVTFENGAGKTYYAGDPKYVNMSSVSHEHVWSYSASGATITATCNNTDKNHSGSTTDTLTIVKPALTTYGGTESADATIKDNKTSVGGVTTLAKIKYQKKTGNSYGTESETAPTAAGDYRASITVEGKKATVEYTIAKKQLTISGTTADNKDYDGTKTATATAGTLSGITTGDTGNVSVAVKSAEFIDKNAGTNKDVKVVYSISGTASANYFAPEEDTVNANINKKDITVTADNKSSAVGKSLVNLTYKATGLVSGDSLTGSLTTDANINVVADYDILQGSLTGGTNYNIATFNKGTYSVTEKSAEPVCKYKDTLKAGTDQILILGCKEAGTFDIEGSSCKGFKLIQDGKYVTYENGKINTDGSSSFTWKYDGGLYAESKTTSKCGCWGFGKKTTKVTKQYLSFDGSNLTLSSCSVCACVLITADEHTFKYLHNGDGYHEAVCVKCDYHEGKVKHTYTDGICICGLEEPVAGSVTNVKVTEKKQTSCSGWFSKSKKTTKYQYTISSETKNVSVKETKYSMDGKSNWKKGSSFTSSSKVNEFYIKITDSNGTETNWKYENGKVTQIMEGFTIEYEEETPGGDLVSKVSDLPQTIKPGETLSFDVNHADDRYFKFYVDGNELGYISDADGVYEFGNEYGKASVTNNGNTTSITLKDITGNLRIYVYNS